VIVRRAALVVLLYALPAHAGRTSYGWLLATDTAPAGTLELGTSIYEHGDLGPFHERSIALLWTPAFGLTDNLELAVPIELASRSADDISPGFVFTRYGAELRYRIPPRASALRPIARFALWRDVQILTQVRSEVELAASYDQGPVQIEADVGMVFDVNIGRRHTELRPGIAANVRLTDELRLGAELHAELSLDSTTTSWAVFGPDIAWTRGRFWIAGVFAIGIHEITAAPRLNLGMRW
jgi:hypothetical protein